MLQKDQIEATDHWSVTDGILIIRHETYSGTGDEFWHRIVVLRREEEYAGEWVGYNEVATSKEQGDNYYFCGCMGTHTGVFPTNHPFKVINLLEQNRKD